MRRFVGLDLLKPAYTAPRHPISLILGNSVSANSLSWWKTKSPTALKIVNEFHTINIWSHNDH